VAHVELAHHETAGIVVGELGAQGVVAGIVAVVVFVLAVFGVYNVSYWVSFLGKSIISITPEAKGSISFLGAISFSTT
jgi:hypothetical protein